MYIVADTKYLHLLFVIVIIITIVLVYYFEEKNNKYKISQFFSITYINKTTAIDYLQNGHHFITYQKNYTLDSFRGKQYLQP